jgi:hypothetical protein
MNTDLIESIAEKSATAIRELIVSHADDIKAAALAATEEAQDAGKDAVSISLSHSIKIDLGKGTQTDKLAVSLKRESSIVTRLDDPAQPELGLEGEQ